MDGFAPLYRGDFEVMQRLIGSWLLPGDVGAGRIRTVAFAGAITATVVGAVGVLAPVSTKALAASTTRPAAFAVCSSCHRVKAGERSGIGPNLFGIGGQAAGTRPGYTYSSAMRSSKVIWNRANLIAFISDPKSKVRGTKMVYAGERDPVKAAAIADYLISLR